MGASLPKSLPVTLTELEVLLSLQPPGTAVRPILLGTSNTAKQNELRWLLEGVPLTPKTPSQMNLVVTPDESGDTHLAIAQAKAREWSQATPMLAIASDGGLLLPVLGQEWESRYTHRFAGPEADNSQRLENLLELMRPYRGVQREASWVEAVAIADKGRVLASWEIQGATGIISDQAIDSPQNAGFWVFSVWYFPQYSKTYDQLSQEEREKLGDHWARLRQPVQDFFRRYLGTGP